MKILARAAVLTNFFEVAREVGLNPLPLLRQVGLSRALLEDPEQRIPVDAAVQLLEMAAQSSGYEAYGLRMAELRQLSDFGVVSLLISHQPTLRAALMAVVQYRHLLNDTLAIQIEDAGPRVVLREEVVAAIPARQSTELAIGVMCRMCSAVLGKHWAPHSIGFAHVAPADTTVYQRVFRCPVEFGAEFNGIVFQASDLDAPNPTADPGMARYAQRFVESLPCVSSPSVVMDVRKAIYLMLPTGRASIDCVAQGLGLSVRTLQRMLDQSNASFTDILNEVRRDLALRYLDNPRYPLMRVSELLGYSTQSSFTRWFIGQFGVPPQRWRSQTRENTEAQPPIPSGPSA